MSKVTEKLFFFFQFLRDRQIASITPTSQIAVKHICQKHFLSHKPCIVVEYGPGTGVFTRYLSKFLHPDSHIIAIERNFEFSEKLSEFASKPDRGGCKITVLNDDVRRICDILSSQGIKYVDYFISGIPLSFLTDEEKSSLLESTRDYLDPEGGFLVYQVSFHALRHLRTVFDRVDRSIFFLNLPPLYCMYATKGQK